MMETKIQLPNNPTTLHPKVVARIKERETRKALDKATSHHEKLLIIGIAFVLGFLFDTFFVGHAWGISVLIYAAFSIGAVHVTNQTTYTTKLSSLFLMTTLLLSATFTVYNNQALRTLNALAIPAVFTAYVLSVRYPTWGTMNVSYLLKILEKLYITTIGSMIKCVPFLYDMSKDRKQSQISASTRHVLLGICIGLPLMLMIMFQLTAADAVFGSLVSDSLKIFDIPDDIMAHSIVTLLASVYIFGYLWSLKYDDRLYKEQLTYKKMMEPMTVITVMSMLSVVYLVFTVIQFSYLYAGMGELPHQLTYAEYARKGFFELLQVTFVNICVILFSILMTKEQNVKLNKIGNIVYSLMTLFTLNLLVSSFYRMHLYEAAYGYTELRLFVQFFIVFLGMALMALLIWIWERDFPMFKTGVTAAIIVYLALNFINVDSLIASNNLERYKSTGEIDAYHLNYLSIDAYDALAKAHADNPDILLKEFEEYHQGELEQGHQWFEYNYYRNHFKSNIE